MTFLSWIVLGLVAGFAGSRLVNKTGQGLAFDVVLGVVGAVVGGLLFSSAGASGTADMNLYSLFVAVIGSIVVLWAWHAFVRRA